MLPIITAHRVSKSFGSTKAVDDLTISIGNGEIVALLGPNGAGKTTLIRMIVGLIKPDGGTVERGYERGPGSVGYLPEERGLYQDMPIQRTLSYFGRLQGMPPRQATDAARMWLDRVGLAARSHEKVKALSKGNQQKVQFAASILHRPRVAILDEPFSGLDPVNQEIFLGLIRTLKDEGTTVIFSAHQMTLVERLADRVFLMSQGREVLHGSIPELRRRWHTGERLVIGTKSRIDSGFLTAVAAVEAVEEQSDEEIRLRIRPDASLSELLRVVGERVDVRYVRSEATSLHEIYLRTVEGASATTAPAETAA